MVYVDNFKAPYRGMIMCHMIADTQEELFAMVDKIGVQRKWVQDYRSNREHFDICLAKRALAVKHGAKEISMMDLGRMTAKKVWAEKLPTFVPCGEGDNICNCTDSSQCGYTKTL